MLNELIKEFMDVKNGLIQPVSTELRKELRACLTLGHTVWRGQDMIVLVMEQ